MLLYSLVAAGWIAWRYPQTPAGGWCKAILVDFPIASMERLERRHIIAAVMLLFFWQAFLMAAPADLALMAMWDLSLYLDAAIATWTLAAVSRGLVTARWGTAMLRTGVKFLVPRRIARWTNRSTEDSPPA